MYPLRFLMYRLGYAYPRLGTAAIEHENFFHYWWKKTYKQTFRSDKLRIMVNNFNNNMPSFLIFKTSSFLSNFPYFDPL